MAWRIQHICRDAPFGQEGEYTVGLSTDEGPPRTRIQCPRCMETFFIEGHEFGQGYRNAQNQTPGAGVIIVPGQGNQPPIRVRTDLGRVKS